MRIPGI